MLNSKTLTRLAMAAALCTAGAQALAHTGVKDQATVSKDSGATSYNAFTITHGCSGGEDGAPIRVKGQSAVFPYGDHTVWKNLANNKTVTAAHVIGNGVLFNLNPGAIQDSSLFSTVTEKADGPADPNAHGAILLQTDYWATLTVENSSVATGAAAADCPGGKPHEVAVMPSGADIDKYLPYGPFTKTPAPY